MTEISNFTLRFLAATPFWAWAALAGLMALTLYQYSRTNPPLPGGMRALLVGLRTLALLALFLTLLEPAVSYDLSGERKPRLALAVDVSGSMNAAGDGASRRSVVDSALGSSAWGAALAEYDVTEYLFAESLLSASAGQDNLQATAIGEALAEMARRERAEPSDYWLIFSDGISNAGRRPQDVLDELTTPIVAIGVGDPDESFDIELSEVSYNPVAYVDNATEVRARLRWRGAAAGSGEALVELRESGATVDSKRIKLGAGDLSAEIDFSYTPKTPGGKFLEARVTAPGTERMKQNNARVFSLTALKSRLQILLVSEALNWDYRFIKTALVSDERVEVTEVIEKAPGQYVGRKFPSSEAQLAEYDVIALHNPSRERSDGRYTALANAVRRGAGVFVFAGDRIAGRASSAKLIDSLLPAYPSSTSAITIRRPSTISLRGENILHPTLRIAEGAERIRDSWSRFPPLQYLAPLNVVRPEAVTLAESEVGAVDLDVARVSGGAPTPIICYHKLGRGKVLLFNGGPLWPMGFQGIDTERASERLRAFIAGGANWLSVSEELAPVRVTPERDVFARGERIGFSGTALDDGYQPLASAEGEIQLYSADGADTLSATLEEIEPGVFQAEFSGVAPGVYRFDGRISSGGQLLKSDTGRIQVTEYSLEERETAPQFGALQSLADRTGGRYAHVSAVDNPRDLLPGEQIQVASAVDVSLRGLWPFLALFIAALAAEWVLRKRYQLL